MNSATTYGNELDAARHALIELRDSNELAPSTLGFHLAALRLYRVLFRHIVVLLGTDQEPLATAMTQTTIELAAKIRDNTVETAGPGTGAAQAALEKAVDHLEVAAEILFTHIGPDGAARSPAGIALVEHVDSAQVLAPVAELIVIATDITGADIPQGPKAALEQTSPVRALAKDAARRRADGASYLSETGPSPDVSGTHWPPVNTHADFQHAILGARTWLAQHYAAGMTGQQIRQFYGVGLALSNHLGYLAMHSYDGISSVMRSREHIASWRDAYRNTEDVITPGDRDKPAGLKALVSAERWLHTQLRDRGKWRPEAIPQPGTPEAQQWHKTSTELARSLPDLATMLYHGIRASVDRRQLYAPDTAIESSTLIRNATWTLTTIQTPAIQRLMDAARQIRPAGRLLAETFDVDPHRGLHETGRKPSQPRPTVDHSLTVDATGPTARMIRQLTRDAPETTTPLPPGTAVLDTRAKNMARRKADRTKIPVPLAQSVVEEVRALTTTVDRLQAEIDGLRATIAWDIVEVMAHIQQPGGAQAVDEANTDAAASEARTISDLGPA